jgi:hypothetical protein
MLGSDMVEVFARGPSHIYRRPIGGVEPSKWSAIPELDVSLVDNRSDLDCMHDGSAIHVVASGANPLGAVLHATGTQTTYNPFQRELGTTTVEPSPAIWTVNRNYVTIAGTITTWILAGQISAGEFTQWPAPSGRVVSSPDIAFRAEGGSGCTQFAAFEHPYALTVQTYIQSSAPARWYDVEFSVPAPSRSPFVFNPTICAGEYQGWNTTFMVAVTEDHRLWFRSASGLKVESLSPEWVKIGDEANSSPECVVTNFGSDVYVVVRSTRNTILLYKGSGRGANWLTSDLGVYDE